MKKNIKMFSALACGILLTLSSSAVFAEFNPESPNSAVGISTKAIPADENTISVDGSIIEGAKLILNENSVFIPIRPVAEALGYEVNWDGENKIISLAKMPSFITFQIGTDGYTFAKTAPMPLGAAPELIDGSTYVPVEVVSELMGLRAELIGGALNIVSSEAEADENEEEFENIETAFGNGEIVSVDEENNQLVINDLEMGEVVLNIEDFNIIKDNDGNTVPFSSLKEGDKLSVEYSPEMTMSIPPINNPVEIIVGEI